MRKGKGREQEMDYAQSVHLYTCAYQSEANTQGPYDSLNTMAAPMAW